MVYFAVHLHAFPGAIKKMKNFENKELKIFRKNGGEVLSAFRPNNFGKDESKPDEIQLLRIKSLKKFEIFLKDPERVKLYGERNTAIKQTKVFISEKILSY